MRYQSVFIILIFFQVGFHSVFALSYQQKSFSLQDQQFDRLNSQQKLLETKINSLLQDVNSIEKNVSLTPDASDKVLLLDRAVLSEREKVFDIQNQLIPPFSLSKTACLQLANQQKIDMLDKIKQAKQQLSKFQEQIKQTPKCDKIIGLEKDAQKQMTLLSSLQKTIYTQCQSKSVLTPTIYQTNIYADGWILGDQNIDDLIEQYYQRNIRYDNITNCPFDKPFFNGQECIICKDPEPVFNILTRECTQCPKDQQPDPILRLCAFQKHYTNFDTVDNWALEGATLPFFDSKLAQCPSQKPYYNGKKCEQCLMPKYWSVKKNLCTECPLEMLFDINIKKCVKPEINELTILQGTRWVTNDCNLTRVIDQRINILKKNKTSKSYKMCPSSKPFYDGILCISCPNEFNIDSRKCVTPLIKGTVYNENARCYVQKQTGFETDPNAANYTTKYPIHDTPTPNCKSAKPYYDGITCIRCLSPFSIFNVDTRKCTACDALQKYSPTERKCVQRQKIYISTNENNLMATPKMSVEDYHAEIAQKIKQNPETVILICKQTEYSNYMNCLTCSSSEVFNVESKTCEICDEGLDSKTKLCPQKTYLYTNLNQNSISRIVALPTTIQQLNATITNNLKIHVNSKLCPQNQPYFDGKTCTNCTTKSFNMTSEMCVAVQCTDSLLPVYNKTTNKCEQCPQNQRYSTRTKKCEKIAYVTNTDAIYFYIEEGNFTKNNLDDQIYNLEADHVVISCEASYPYWNGQNCIDCAIDKFATDLNQLQPYFNLKTLKCQGCANWNNETKKCGDTKICSSSTPYLNPVTKMCEACQQNMYFNTSTGTCMECQSNSFLSPQTGVCKSCSVGQVFNINESRCEKLVSNVAAMQYYIEQKNGTRQNLESQIEEIKQKENIQVCPSQTPFYSKTEEKCISCNEGEYWNLLKEMCQACESYDAETHKCQSVIPRFNVNTQNFYSTIFEEVLGE